MKIDDKLFWSRVRQMWRSLKEGKENSASSFNGADALLVWMDKNPDDDEVDVEYSRSSAVSLHLFNGYEFPETLFIFTTTSVIMVASEKKVKLVEPCRGKDSGEGGVKLNLELIVRPKDQTGWKEACEKAAEACKKACSGSNVLGLVHKRNGTFASLLKGALEEKDLSLNFDGLAAVEEALLAKDDTALKSMLTSCKKVGQVSETFRKQIVMNLEDKPLTHAAAVAKVDSLLKVEDDDEDKEVESTRITAIASGTNASDFNYVLNGWKSSAPSRNISLDVITFRAGAANKSFNSMVARTIYIDPTPFQKECYLLVIAMRDAAIAALKPGVKASHVYQAVKKIVDQQERVPHSAFAMENVGFAVGLGYEETFQLSAKNERVIPSGATFVIELRLENLKMNPDAEDDQRTFPCWLADVCLVKSSSGAEVLTSNAHFEWNKNHFRFEEEDEEEEPVRADEPVRRRTRQQARKEEQREEPEKKLTDEAMMRRQGERIVRKQQEGLARANRGEDGGDLTGYDDDDAHKRIVSAYSNPKEFSPEWRRDRIHVDPAKECVLLPIGNRLIPFHISSIKNVAKQDEGDAGASIRFNFHFPAGGGSKDMAPEMLAAISAFPALPYVKELTYTNTKDRAGVTKLVQQVKDLQKRFRDKFKMESEERDLVEQAPLVILKDRPKELPATLNDVSMLPTFQGKNQRCVGRLRAHVNGFRFQAEKQGEVDFLYSNVRYFFFQRGERENKVLIHFFLRDPILIGKKKSKHVQFFTEVQEGGLDLGGRGVDRYDRDELDDEERQRKLVAKLNKMFAQFCKQSIEIAKMHGNTIGDDNDIEISNTEQTRAEGFYGTYIKDMVLIQPTQHCLVNLTDKDFFVICADDIEHVHFERVSIGKSKNFDIVFILKKQLALDGSGDNIKVVRLDNVAMNDMDKVRKWIDEHDPITYTAGIPPLNWDQVLETVRYELQEGIFWKDTYEEKGKIQKKDIGWLFLNPEGADASDEEGEDESDDDSSYDSGSDESDDEEEEDSDDDLGSVVDDDDDDDDDEEYDEDDEDEEGEDWDELERQAEKEDRARKKKDQEKDERDKKRHKSG